LAVQPLTKQLARKLGVRSDYGVVVKQVAMGSPAAKAGIKRNDVILKIDGHNVNNVKTFERLAQDLGEGHALRMLLDRQGDQVFVIVVPNKKR